MSENRDEEMYEQEMQELSGVDPTEERRGLVFENIAKGGKTPRLFEKKFTPGQMDAYRKRINERAARIPEGSGIETVKDPSFQAVLRNYGDFRGATDPTGMMREGELIEDIRRSDLPLLESRRTLKGENVFLPSFRDPSEASEEIFAYQDLFEEEEEDTQTTPVKQKSLAQKLHDNNVKKANQQPSTLEILGSAAKDVVISAIGGTERSLTRPDTLTTRAGAISAVEGLGDLVLLLGQETFRSGRGGISVLADTRTYTNIRDEINNYFSPKKQSRNFLPTNKTAMLTYLQGRKDMQGHIDSISRYLEDNAKQALGLDDNVAFSRYYDNVRGFFEIPADRENAFTKAASISGMLTLFGGSLAATRGAVLLARNSGRVYVASRAALRTGITKNFKDNFFNRQVLNIDFGKTYAPDRFYRTLSEGASIEHHAKIFELGGVPRAKAVEMAKNARRDFLGAVAGGTLYSIFDSIFQDDMANMGAAFTGSLLGNWAVRNGQTLFSRGLLNTVTRLASSDKGEFRKSIEAFKNSDFKGMNTLRKTFLRVHGLETTDINAARRSSFTQGEEVLEKIRILEKEGNGSQAAKVKTKAISEGLLDDKGRAHGWYVLGTILESGWTKNNIKYGAAFHKIVLDSDTEDSRRAIQHIARLQTLLDDLYTQAPKAMEKFPLLAEQVLGFSKLQAMRNALMSNVEFSSFSGKVVSGSLISETEKYQELLSDQAVKLKEAFKEFTQSGDIKQSDALNELSKDINRLISEQNLDFDLGRLQKLKKYANSSLNIQTKAIEDNVNDLMKMSGMNGIGNEIVRKERGIQSINLLQRGFSSLQDRAKQPFDKLKIDHADLEIDVSDFMVGLPAEFDNIEKNVRSLFLNFGKFDNATMNRLYRDASTDFFKKQMGLSSTEAITTPEQYQAFQTQIQKFINQNPVVGGQGTAEEKKAIFNDVMQNARRIEQSGEAVNYSDLANMVVSNMIAKYEIPAKLNVDTLMTMRSAMGDMARQRFNANDFDGYRIIKERINQFDTALENNSGIFGGSFVQDYAKARKHYSDVFRPYLEDGSPFFKIANTGGQERRQPVSPSKLFQMFFTGGDDTASNARHFAKVFSDADGNINPEAIDVLLYSMTDYMVDSYKNLNLTSLDKVMKEVVSEFAPMIRQANKSKYVDTLENMVAVLSKDGEEVIQARKQFGETLSTFINNSFEVRKKVFRDTAVAQLGRPVIARHSVHLNALELKMNDIQEKLLTRTLGEGSLKYDTYENFISSIKNSTEYERIISDVPELKDEIDAILSNSEFVKTFKTISTGPSGLSGKPTLEIILTDAKDSLERGFMSQADYDRIVKNAGILIDDNFMRHMFPYINRARPTNYGGAVGDMEEVSTGLATALREIGEKRGLKYRQVLNQLRLRNSEIMLELNRRGFGKVDERLGLRQRKFKFNVEHEYDMVAAQNWWDENKEVYALIKDKEHMEFIDNLMETGAITRGMSTSATEVRNAPKEYTTAQGLGRVYNTFGKHVVSPAYIGMEKAVVDFRVARANIVKDLLTNKESAKFLTNIFSEGLFEPTKARAYIKRIAFRLAVTGHKLTGPNAVDEIFKELERTASEVRKEKEQET